MYAPLGAIVLLNRTIEKLLFGFNSGINVYEEVWIKLPFIKIFENFQNMQYYYTNKKLELEISTIIVYIIVSVIMLLVGYFIYKKRKL